MIDVEKLERAAAKGITEGFAEDLGGRLFAPEEFSVHAHFAVKAVLAALTAQGVDCQS